MAIITGAASGMGKAIAEGYAKEDAQVVVSDLNLNGVKAGVEAIAVQANVASEKDLEQLLSETKKAFGNLDILVNNSGIMNGMEYVGGLYGIRADATYTTSKHTVVCLTKNTTFMYANKNIRCNGTAPGAVITNISSTMTNLSEFGASRQALGNKMNSRARQPGEVTKLAIFFSL